MDLEIDRDSLDVYITGKASNGGSVHKLLESLKPAPGTDQTPEQQDRGSDRLLQSLKILKIKNIKNLDNKLNNVAPSQIEKFQEAVTQWLAEKNISAWSTNRFDMAKSLLIVSASKEDASKVLSTSPFNEILTSKLKAALGIADGTAEGA